MIDDKFCEIISSLLQELSWRSL